MSIRSAGVAIVAAAALSGCAGLPTPDAPLPPTPAATPTPRTTVATVDLHTVLSGRLNLRVRRPSDGATDGGSLLFEFEGHADRGTLLLQTAIGTTIARARWSPEGAEVVTAQGRRTGQRLDDVATLLLGQSLPLAALLQWMQAKPWPQAPSQPLEDGFEQLGWRISLAAWHERVVTARRAPSVERPDDHEIVVRVRLDEPGESTAPTAAPGS